MATKQSLTSGLLSPRQMQELLSGTDLWKFSDASGIVGGKDRAEWMSSNDLSSLGGYTFDTEGSTKDGTYTLNLYDPSGKKITAKQFKNTKDSLLDKLIVGGIGVMGAGAAGWLGAGAGGSAAGMTGAEWGALADSAAGATSGVFGTTEAAGAVGAAGASAPLALSGAAAPTAGFLSTAELPALAEVGALGAGEVGAGTGAALSSADKAALFGGEGYGAGLSGAQTTAYDSVLGATGSKGLADVASTATGGLSNAWGSLTPAQQLQLAGAVGSGLVGALAPGADKTASNNQAGAAGLQMDIANQLKGIGTQQLANATQRQAQFDPKFQQIIDAALKSQQTNDARSADVWKVYQDYLMPAQRRLADTAANFDTVGRRNAAGAEAVAGVDAQFQRNREAQQRDLGRAGVSLTSGRSLTLDAAQRFAQAKAAAGADRVARQGVEDRGIALTQGVASMANPTAGLGLNASQLGLQAGGVGSNTAATQQNTYNQSLQPGLTALQGANAAAGGAGNTYNGVANVNLAQQQQDNAGYAGLGSLIGQLGGLYFSDPETKTKARGHVSGKQARRSLEDAKVSRWKYKKGYGDEGEHIGRMAGKGDIKGRDGLHRIDAISELGTHHAAIADISKEVKAMRKRLSLADAKGGR